MTVTNASSAGSIGTGRWSHRPADSGHFQVPQEKLEIMRRAGVWVALRGTPFPTKGPTLLIMILAPILFISLSRHYVPMKQSSNGTKEFRRVPLLCRPRLPASFPKGKRCYQSLGIPSRATHCTYTLVHGHTHTHTHVHMHTHPCARTCSSHTYAHLCKLTYLDSPSHMHPQSHMEGSPSHPYIYPYKCTHSGSLSHTLTHTPSHLHTVVPAIQVVAHYTLCSELGSLILC